MSASVINKSEVQDINLSVLKRVDSDIEQVLGNAAHVCLYSMTMENHVWERKNIEGSLYLLKRRTSPRFLIAVLNKLSTENYMETIHGAFDVEVSSPYLMYTLGDGMVHGIWFYDEQELDQIANLLKRVKAGLPKPDVHPSRLQGEMASAAGAKSADDGTFWDRKAQEQPAAGRGPPHPQAQVPAPPPPPRTNHIENLSQTVNMKQLQQPVAKQPGDGMTGIKQMQKQVRDSKAWADGGSQPDNRPQQQAPNAGAEDSTSAALQQQMQGMKMSAGPPSAAEPVAGLNVQEPLKPLPPSYFLKQQEQEQEERVAHNKIDKHDEVVAPPLHKSPNRFKPSPVLQKSDGNGQPGKPTAALSPAPKPLPDGASRAAAKPSVPQQAPLSAAQQQQALQQAMSRLVQRPAFLDMLTEELQCTGVLMQ